MADRLCVTTITPPLRHANTDEAFQVATNNTDKLYFLDEARDGGYFDKDRRIKCFGVSGSAFCVERFNQLLNKYTLIELTEMGRNGIDLNLNLSVMGYTSENEVFQYTQQYEAPHDLTVHDAEASAGGVFVIGSGCEYVTAADKLAAIIKTPLDAMLLANSNDAYTGLHFDYITIKEMTWVRNAFLTKRQRDLALSKIENRFVLTRSPRGFPQTHGKDGYKTTVDRV